MCLAYYRESKYRETSNYTAEPIRNEYTSAKLVKKHLELKTCNRKVELFSHCAIKRSLQANVHGFMV